MYHTTKTRQVVVSHNRLLTLAKLNFPKRRWDQTGQIVFIFVCNGRGTKDGIETTLAAILSALLIPFPSSMDYISAATPECANLPRPPGGVHLDRPHGGWGASETSGEKR